MLLADLLALIEQHRLPQDTEILIERDRDEPDPHTGETVYEDGCAGASLRVTTTGHATLVFHIDAG